MPSAHRGSRNQASTPCLNMQEPEPPHLCFGNDSQAHYNVPVGDREAYVLLGCPKGLRPKDHEAFASALEQLRRKLQRTMEMLPGYEDQPHVTPDLRVYQPGTYADYGSSNMLSHGPTPKEYYQLYFHYGSHSVEMQFPSDVRNTRTTQRAVNRLLEAIQVEAQGALRGNFTVTVPPAGEGKLVSAEHF